MSQEILRIISDRAVILSQDKNSDSVDAKFIICDFDPNANGVSINRNTIEEWLDTLLNKPVVGKVVTNYNGKDDFSGHNAKIVTEIDDDGNEIKTIEFDTEAFGSFYQVGIETIDNTEYIVATAKIWKRFKKAYKVFKNRVESKKGLKTSWEISVSKSHQEKIKNKNIKVIDQGVFIGHALLGANVQPAYKASGVIDVAEKNYDSEFAEAITQDLVAISEEAEEKNNKIKGGSDLSNDSKNRTASITDNDLYRKVRKAINSLNEDKYYYLSMIYPYEFKAIAYTWDRDSDEDFVCFTYTVSSDDTINITSQEEVKMKFVPKKEQEKLISSLEEKISQLEKEISDAGKALTELTKQKEAVDAQISELSQYKEKVEEMERAEKERELSEKAEQLRAFVLEDQLIEESELETDEQLSLIFSELTLENYEKSQEKIEVIKGRRAIQKFKESKKGSSATNLETSSITQTHRKVKANLNNSDSNILALSATDLIKNYLKK